MYHQVVGTLKQKIVGTLAMEVIVKLVKAI
jgi:hypothetical protein